MIDEPRESPDQETVSCRECQREVPTSEAKTVEGRDYFWYFCGLDCYERWRRRADRDQDARS